MLSQLTKVYSRERSRQITVIWTITFSLILYFVKILKHYMLQQKYIIKRYFDTYVKNNGN